MKLVNDNKEFDAGKKFIVEVTLTELAVIASSVGEHSKAELSRMIADEYDTRLADVVDKLEIVQDVFEFADGILSKEVGE